METKDYLNSKWPDLGAQPTIQRVVKKVNEVNEIDEDIEKEIRNLQEQKFQQGIKSVLPKEVDILGHKLDSFLSTVQVEKEQLEEKVKKEEIKIDALEEFFNTLKKEKEDPVEEKKVETKAQVKKEPKKDEASAIKSQEIQAASNLLEYLLPKKVQKYDDSIIDKVSKQISEMKVANNLEKDKISKLRSIDTLEKLTEEFLRFKNITSVQLSTLGGGGSTNILDNDDVDLSSIGNGKILEYNSTTKKMQFVTSGDSVNNLEVLGSITFEGSTADDFETTFNVVDPTADRTITLPNVSGTVPVLAAVSATQITATPEELNYVDGVTGNIQTALDAKATKAFAIAQAVALG
jgi:hypothetical protein